LARGARLRQFDANIARAGGRMAERERESVPFCWFCPATSGRKSKEHIFPQWLSAHYGARTEVVTPHRVSAMTGKLLSERPPKPLSGFKCGDVCGDCNNGWMSQLEDRVRPILTADKRTGRLTLDEAGVLAHWFVKTAAVLNVSQPYRLLFPARDRHALATGIPERAMARIFKARTQNGLVDWVQGAPSGSFSPKGVPNEVATSLQERTLMTHIRVGDLVGVVILVPAPLSVTKAVIEHDASRRIWPLPDTLPKWGRLPVRKDYLDHFTSFTYDHLVFGW
jgi:hypothetical protein